MQITVEMLKKAKACAPQLELFEQLFPSGSPSSKEEALAAAVKYANRFDWCWASNHLLPTPASLAYDEAEAPAWEVYDEARAPARKVYDEAEASALKAYDEAKASARKVYDEAEAALSKVYDEAKAPAWKVYNEARADAFVEAWFSVYPKEGG